MIRLITDPEADFKLSSEAGPAEPVLEDTLSSVSGLAWLVGPVAPRTVGHVHRPSLLLVTLPASGGIGESALEIQNGQESATPIALAVSSFRAPGGQVWAPQVEPGTVIVAPGEVRTIEVRLQSGSPPEPGTYEGELRLLGVEGAVVQVVAEVTP